MMKFSSEILLGSMLLFYNMSTILQTKPQVAVTEQKIGLHWHKLQVLLSKLTKEQVDQLNKNYFEKEKYDVSLCVRGLMTMLTAVTKSDKMNISETEEILKELGFTEENAYKNRYCMEVGCTYFSSLVTLMNHMHVFHNISYENIAKMIPHIASDTREPPNGLAGIVASIKNIPMNKE